MSPNPPHEFESLEEATLDLLAARATQGLTADERDDLRRSLMAAGLDPDAPDELELAAAELELDALSPDHEPLPASVRERVASDAIDAWKPASTRLNTGAWLGWAAAAAMAIVAGIGWWQTLPPSETPVGARYVQLKADAVDAVLAEWAATEDQALYDGVTGDVVFSADRQEGYMRFVGLPVNDPAQAQYQLWIVDPTRDAEPVDGGVFDVTMTGEVVVPIDAKLPVQDASLFVITLEQPGGVVVSEGPFRLIADPNS